MRLVWIVLAASTEMAWVSASAQLIRSPTDRSRLQAFVHSSHASARVRTNPKKLSPVATGKLA